MGLAVKNGQEVTLTFEGEDEEAAYEAVSPVYEGKYVV